MDNKNFSFDLNFQGNRQILDLTTSLAMAQDLDVADYVLDLLGSLDGSAAEIAEFRGRIYKLKDSPSHNMYVLSADLREATNHLGKIVSAVSLSEIYSKIAKNLANQVSGNEG